MNYLELTESSGNLYLYISIGIFLLFVFYILSSIKIEVKTLDKKTFSKKESTRVSNLVAIDNIKLFKDINLEAKKLEEEAFGLRLNSTVAFLLGDNARETLDWLIFLEEKEAKILSASNNKTKTDESNTKSNTELNGVSSIFLEDKNGVIYIIFIFRENEIVLEGKTLITYGLLTPYVLGNNNVMPIYKTKVDDLFLPREKGGEPSIDSLKNTNISETIENDKGILIIEFFWNKGYNVRFRVATENLFK